MITDDHLAEKNRKGSSVIMKEALNYRFPMIIARPGVGEVAGTWDKVSLRARSTGS
jgi:hypothetical protein